MQFRQRLLTLAGLAIMVGFGAALILQTGESPERTPTLPRALTPTELPTPRLSSNPPSQASTTEPRAQTIQVQMPDGEARQVVNVVLNGTGELPPGATLTLMSANPMRDDRFQTEPVDPAWAPGMEAAIYSVVSAVTSDVMEITEVECRTTICRAIAEHRYAEGELGPEALRTATDSAMRLFEESFRPLVATPNGRLNSLSISGESSESGHKTVFSLSGPPLGTRRPGQP